MMRTSLNLETEKDRPGHNWEMVFDKVLLMRDIWAGTVKEARGWTWAKEPR